jgi:hypothetical protein
MISVYTYMIRLCCVVMLISCGSEVEQEDLIQSAVEIKLGQYRTNQLNECKDNALRDAEDYVDSLLVAISLEKKLDTIPKPGKPSRPPRPIFKDKPDSIVVDRIYKEEQ